MQLPDISAASNVVRLTDSPRKTRVLYAGDMEFAKAQFASVAPQLQLIAASQVLASGANAAAASAEALDVVLIDCGAPGVDARAIVEGIRARSLDLPIVLALDPSVTENAPTKVTAELRVDDYTMKLPGWLARLTSRLEFAIAHHRRRRSLETVQAAAERLRTVVESAPVCLARVARDGTILAINAAAMKMVSAETPEEVLGKSLFSFVGSDGADGVRSFLDTVSAGHPGSLEFETVGVSGARVVDTRAIPLSPDAEGRASALLVLRDTTERKRLEDSMLANANPGAGPQAEAGALAEERDSLRRQLDAALEECRRIETERGTLAEEAEEARARAAMVEHVRAACTAAEQQLGELQNNYQRIVTERDALAEDLAGARLRHDAAVAERQAERDRVEPAEAERARLASRCETLDSLVASLEATLAAEREEHRVAREQAEAERQRLSQLDPLAAEREALLASLGTLRTQFDEMKGALEAAEARHAADMRDQRAATAAAEVQLRDVEEARAHTAAQRDAHAAEGEAIRAELTKQVEELQAQVNAASAQRGAHAAEGEAIRVELTKQVEELQAQVNAANAQRGAHAAEGEAIRVELRNQVEELQARVNAAIAERDAIAGELRAATQGADARTIQLQQALDEARASRDAQAAEHEAGRRELQNRIEELQTRVNAAAAERDAVRHEMRLALDTADARSEQLQALVNDMRAGRDTQAAESDLARRELIERLEELQTRVHAAIDERDALRREMSLAVDAADARSGHLQAALDDMRAARDAQAAEVDGIRLTLTQRVDELQTRLDGVIIDREALERALDAARAEQDDRVREAVADRESLRRRLEERDAEYTLLSARQAALQAERERRELAIPAAKKPPSAALPPSAELHDAQAAFREAFQLLSGELQNAVETTRAQQAAILRRQPAGYDAIEERLRLSEADCRRLAAERDERDMTVRALQAEIEQLIELRREQRKELVRALQESDETERRAAARLAECARMRQMLTEAQAALERLSKWASNQSARLVASPVGGQRTQSRIEAPAARSTRRDEGPAAPPLEASWS